MNRTLHRYLILTGTITSLSYALAVPAAEPEIPDRSKSESGTYRGKDKTDSESRDARGRETSPQSFVHAALLSGLKEVRSSQIALERSQNTEVKTFAQRMIQDHTKLNDQLRQLASARSWNMPRTNTFDTTTSRSSDRDRKNGTRPSDTPVSNPRSSDSREQGSQDRAQKDYSGDREKTGKEANDKRWAEGSGERMEMQARMSVETLRNTPAEEFDKAYVREVARGHAYSVKKFEQASQQNTDEEVRNLAKTAVPQLKEHHQQATKLAQSLGVTLDNPKEASPLHESDKKNRN